MKRILFVINNMYMGGSRISLISLMNELSNKPELEIYLLVIEHNGILMERINNKIRLLPEDKILKSVFCRKQNLSNISEKFVRLNTVLMKKIIGFDNTYKHIFKNYVRRASLPNFDLVVGYQEGESNDLSSIIPGRRHCIWYHCNYKNYYQIEAKNRLKYLFDKVDNIVFVTEESKNCFARINNNHANKCCVIPNIIPIDYIKEKSTEKAKNYYQSNGLRLVSVGRINEAKGFDRAIEVALRLKNLGYSFKWIIIGGGDLLPLYRGKCDELGINDVLHFPGEINNPYPIVAQADVFVMTSYYEAQPLVVLEALALNKPFVSTNFDSAKDVLNLNCGLIVENSTDGIFDGLKSIFDNHDIIKICQESASRYIYSNNEIIRDFMGMLR